MRNDGADGEVFCSVIDSDSGEVLYYGALFVEGGAGATFDFSFVMPARNVNLLVEVGHLEDGDRVVGDSAEALIGFIPPSPRCRTVGRCPAATLGAQTSRREWAR